MITRVGVTIRAPIKHCLAYCGYHNEQYQEVLTADDPNLLRDCAFDRTPRCHYYINQFQIPFPLANRELLARCVWEKLPDGSFHFGCISAPHPDYPVTPNFVRMSVARSVKFVAISPTLTKAVFTSEINLGGSIPRAINDSITVPALAGTPLNMMNYFACVRDPDAYTRDDATELGKLTFLSLYPLQGRREELRVAVTKMIARNDAFRAFQAKYEFLDECLYHIVRNKMKIGAAQAEYVVNAPLAALTPIAAGHIARSFPKLLMSNVNGEAAVDEFVLSYPALGEMDDEFTWFRPMMVAVANELASKVAYGVKVRAGIGGSFSMLDLVSDVAIISEYIATGRMGFAYLLIGMVAANISFQLIIVWINTQGLTENKLRTMLPEMLATLLFIKPGLDVWKVASGAEQQPGSAASPLQEMTYSKGCEMVLEAIPGMALQFTAILRAKDRSTTAIVSLLISAASAGLTATSIFFDTDVDPGARKRNPAWVGAIPDHDRGLAFATIFTFCTLHVLAKGVATALFFIANPLFLKIYIAVDYGLYFVYTAARKDVVMYTPLPAKASWIISPVFKTMLKVIGDFSGSPVVRLPLLLGGSYYIFNLMSAQASVLIAVYLYNVEMADVIDTDKMAASTLWMMAITLVVAWCIVMAFFLVKVVTSTHRYTFWSGVSGRQCVQEYFTKGVTDEGKLNIFNNNMLLWESDIGSEVMVHASELGDMGEG
jgi:hypothetical protein